MQSKLNYKYNKADSTKSFLFSILFFTLLYILLIILKFGNNVSEVKEDIIEIDKIPEEIVMHQFETSEKKGGGSGTEVKAPITKEFVPQTEKILNDKNSSTNADVLKGNSNHSNSQTSTENESSTTKASSNPFGTGGSGGGSQGGNGNGFGTDNGDGNGKGKGGGEKARIRLNDPNTEGISSDYNCKISLKLTINSEGAIIKAENIVAKTTTTNHILINQVLSNVKSQVKYNKKPNSNTEIVFLTVNLSAK